MHFSPALGFHVVGVDVFALFDVLDDFADVFAILDHRGASFQVRQRDLVADRDVILGGQRYILFGLGDGAVHLGSGLQPFNDDDADIVFRTVHQIVRMVWLGCGRRFAHWNFLFGRNVGIVLYKTRAAAVVNMTKHIPVHDSRASTLPLYTQVRDTLFERIKSGSLRPGEELGSEFQLAAELGVSQGTVRKALEVLRAENLLVRQQGRGTFVAEQTPASVLFRYFNIFDDSGKQVLPDSRQVRVATSIANVEQQRRLRIEPDTNVIRMTRIRTWQRRGKQQTPFITETIILPQALFPGLENLSPMPNTLYDLFQSRYRITVTHIDERITPVQAPALVADQLELDHGMPLLLIDRTTYSLGGAIVEWRLSYCHMSGCHYRLQVR